MDNNDARQRFLLRVARTGQIVSSAVAVGLGRSTVYDWRKSDKSFAADIEQALDRYRDAIDDEVRRRGVEGVEEPIFFQGNLVGWLRKYSDALLIAHAKAHDPRYRDRAQVDVNHKGSVMVVPAAPVSNADWQNRFAESNPS